MNGNGRRASARPFASRRLAPADSTSVALLGSTESERWPSTSGALLPRAPVPVPMKAAVVAVAALVSPLAVRPLR
jgi:hypothetical protein